MRRRRAVAATAARIAPRVFAGRRPTSPTTATVGIAAAVGVAMVAVVTVVVAGRIAGRIPRTASSHPHPWRRASRSSGQVAVVRIPRVADGGAVVAAVVAAAPVTVAVAVAVPITATGIPRRLVASRGQIVAAPAPAVGCVAAVCRGGRQRTRIVPTVRRP